MKQRKFIVKIETPGLLISLKGKTVRTPVTIIATEDEIPLIKLQVKTNSAGCKIDEYFEDGIVPIYNKEEKVETKKEEVVVKKEKKEVEKEEDFNFSNQVDIEELSIKYETLLDKMIKSTK